MRNSDPSGVPLSRSSSSSFTSATAANATRHPLAVFTHHTSVSPNLTGTLLTDSADLSTPRVSPSIISTTSFSSGRFFHRKNSHDAQSSDKNLASQQRPSRTKAPWALDTFWPSCPRRNSRQGQNESRDTTLAEPLPPVTCASPTLDCRSPSRQSSWDPNETPLTPPDSSAPLFGLPAFTNPSLLPPSETDLHYCLDLFGKPHKSPPSTIVASQPSKNDIFNTPSQWIAPPKNPAPVSASPNTTSKNSLFFSSTQQVIPPPSPSSASPQSSVPRVRSASHVSATHVDAFSPNGSNLRPTSTTDHETRPSFGRSSTDEREREHARIRRTKNVEFRLSPSPEYMLGEGRHCNVYLGSYLSRKRPHDSDSEQVLDPFQEPSRRPTWKLCAIKRLYADRHSQLLGLDEVFILRRLGSHPHIIRLIDICDEVELSPTPPTLSPSPASLHPKGCKSSLGKGLPQGPGSHTRGKNMKASVAHATLGHARSVSDSVNKIDILKQAKTPLDLESNVQRPTNGFRKTSLAVHPSSIKQHQSKPIPVLTVAGPDGTQNHHHHGVDDDDVSMDMQAEKQQPPSLQNSPTSSPCSDPPRLLILLELLPNSLAKYAKTHAERIDYLQWLTWAKQMAEAVTYLHSKGCVHADLKKENMLLTEDLEIKLCDFNSALFLNPNDLPTDGMGLGTPAYGAPELSRATGGAGATCFSFPIDVFSLGAVLYSLATGVEPFNKATSVVEVLHRKKAFFESEENDRASRLAVLAGSNPASNAASRNGSIRGRRLDQPKLEDGLPLSPSSISRCLSDWVHTSYGRCRRGTSADSIESVTSSITTMSGRSPSSAAVARLLNPSLEPKGLLVDEIERCRKDPLLPEAHDVCPEGRTSIGHFSKDSHQPNADVNSNSNNNSNSDTEINALVVSNRMTLAPAVHLIKKDLAVPFRLDTLRKRPLNEDHMSSSSSSSSVEIAMDPSLLAATATTTNNNNNNIIAYNSPVSRFNGMGIQAGRMPETPISPIGLNTKIPTILPVSPHFRSNSSSNYTSYGSPLITTSPSFLSSPSIDQGYLDGGDSEREEEEEDQDQRSYSDGHPALILPGGGRLPDQVRELLRSMVHPTPSLRPTASQVFEAFQRFSSSSTTIS